MKANKNHGPWITVETGIRKYEHLSRKHGKKYDTYYALRYTAHGTRREEGLGWTSEGWTLEKVRATLAQLRIAKTTGEGEITLREKRTAAKEKREREIKIQQEAKRDNLTFSDVWNQYYLPHLMHSTKTSENKSKEIQLYTKWIQPILENVIFKTLSPPQVQAISNNMLEQGRAPRTARYALAVISQIWTCAFNNGLVATLSPTKRVKKPQEDNRRVRFLTQEETTLLLAELHKTSKMAYDIALLSYLTGIRAGEIFTLTWIDVDLSQRTIFIKDPKNGQNRYAFMTDEIYDMMKARSVTTISKNSFVFSWAEDQSRPLSQIPKAYAQAVIKLELNKDIIDIRQKVCFHTLRHSFASALVQEGVPLFVLKELLGHKTTEMTNRYSHLSPQSVKTAAMQMQGKLNIPLEQK